MREKYLILIIGLLFPSCAATLPYAADYPLTDQYFHSRDKVFSGRVPTGWFSATDDTLGESLTVWLLKEDFSATITMREIKLDPLSRRQVDDEGLALLASMSRAFNNTVQLTDDVTELEFELQGNKYAGYETNSGQQRIRTIVFIIRGRYYECEARALNGRWSETNINGLFTIQQSVLSSVIF